MQHTEHHSEHGQTTSTHNNYILTRIFHVGGVGPGLGTVCVQALAHTILPGGRVITGTTLAFNKGDEIAARVGTALALTCRQSDPRTVVASVVALITIPCPYLRVTINITAGDWACGR